MGALTPELAAAAPGAADAPDAPSAPASLTPTSAGAPPPATTSPSPPGSDARDALSLRVPPGVSRKVLRRMARYLRAYARTAIVLDGCQAAKVTRSAVESWRHRHPFFAVAEAEAREAGADQLERHLHERATRGARKPILNKTGEVIGYTRAPSDVLLMFALKGARPAKYKEHEIGNSDLVHLLSRIRDAAAKVRGDAVAARLAPGGDGGADAVIELPATATPVSPLALASPVTPGAMAPGSSGAGGSDDAGVATSPVAAARAATATPAAPATRIPAAASPDTQPLPLGAPKRGLRPDSLLAAVYAGARDTRRRPRPSVPRGTISAPSAPPIRTSRRPTGS